MHRQRAALVLSCAILTLRGSVLRGQQHDELPVPSSLVELEDVAQLLTAYTASSSVSLVTFESSQLESWRGAERMARRPATRIAGRGEKEFLLVDGKFSIVDGIQAPPFRPRRVQAEVEIVRGIGRDRNYRRVRSLLDAATSTSRGMILLTVGGGSDGIADYAFWGPFQGSEQAEVRNMVAWIARLNSLTDGAATTQARALVKSKEILVVYVGLAKLNGMSVLGMADFFAVDSEILGRYGTRLLYDAFRLAPFVGREAHRDLTQALCTVWRDEEIPEKTRGVLLESTREIVAQNRWGARSAFGGAPVVKELRGIADDARRARRAHLASAIDRLLGELDKDAIVGDQEGPRKRPL